MEGKKRTSAADHPPKRYSIHLQRRRSISWHASDMHSTGQNSEPSSASFSGGGAANPTKIKMEIEAQQALLMQHWENRNMTPLSELYTSGCSVMPPDASINFGRPGNLDFLILLI